MNIKHIFNGIKNSIFVKEEVEKIANFRREICEGCPKISIALEDSLKGAMYLPERPDVHCTECACNLHLKTRSLHSSCPIGKWNSVATESENIMIQSAIELE